MTGVSVLSLASRISVRHEMFLGGRMFNLKTSSVIIVTVYVGRVSAKKISFCRGKNSRELLNIDI